MKRSLKLTVLCPLLFCLLLFAGCGAASYVLDSSRVSPTSADSAVPFSENASANQQESASNSSEPPTFYMGNPPNPDLLAINDGKGRLHLPDGRYITEEGIFLPDGTKTAGWEDCTIELFGMEKVVTLPDGTKIIDPYSGGYGGLVED